MVFEPGCVYSTDPTKPITIHQDRVIFCHSLILRISGSVVTFQKMVDHFCFHFWNLLLPLSQFNGTTSIFIHSKLTVTFLYLNFVNIYILLIEMLCQELAWIVLDPIRRLLLVFYAYLASVTKFLISFLNSLSSEIMPNKLGGGG